MTTTIKDIGQYLEGRPRMRRLSPSGKSSRDSPTCPRLVRIGGAKQYIGFIKTFRTSSDVQSSFSTSTSLFDLNREYQLLRRVGHIHA